MPRAGASRPHLSSQSDEEANGPEVVVRPSPARPRRSKNDTLKIRPRSFMDVDEDPLPRFIWEAFKKIEDPNTQSDTQRDILVNKYKSISLANRQKFIECVLHNLKIVLAFLSENEKGNKKESDYYTN
ncbi:Oidioi.mRNA.OKI2018_I69.PAR.g11122.t1.cds [Oikopleura dioica]|uniref:Oidioi.mRNA.OKI2018_I69.PAR.g11122.t1.cds n=1 Tax=Oikopleura dioica TaxID=34765 RepID=A0ABN7RXE0_OIKDI|nr:Oidioi.mRNA.OKI2018_I69.PAR.g11122.t1.cds [Oikopleura dioica]